MTNIRTYYVHIMKRKRAELNKIFDEDEDMNEDIDFKSPSSSSSSSSSSCIEKLLQDLGDSTSSSSTCINPSKAARQCLQTSGALMDMVTSSCFRKLSSSLSETSLVHLLSAIMDEFVVGKKNDKKSTTIHNNNYNHNNVLSLLSFIERLFLHRYNISFQKSDILQTWHSLITTGIMLANGPTGDDEKNDNNKGINIPQRNEDMLNCDANEGSKNWTISLTFMMAYDILYNRIKTLSRENNDKTILDVKSDNTKQSTPTTRKINFLSKAAQDPIILKSLRVICILLVIDSDHKNSNVNEKKKDSILMQIFAPHLNRVSSLVDSLQKQQKITSYEKKIEEKKESAGPCSPKTSNDIFMNLLKEVEKGFDETLMEYHEKIKSSSDTVISNDNNDYISQTETTMKNQSREKIDIGQSSQDTKEDNDSVVEHDDDQIHTNQTEQIDQNSSLKTAIQQHEFERAAKELRSLMLSTNFNQRNQDDLDEISEKIVNLIEMAGSEDGANGVFHVGSILAFGTEKEKWLEIMTKFSLCLDQENKRKEFQMPFTDTLVSNFYKKCLNEQTSHVRASIFMQSFILPLLLDLKTQKAPFASRTLASIILTLTKERPKESIKVLLLPTLCGTGLLSMQQDEPINQTEMSQNPVTPSRAQCDLVGRVLKSVSLQKGDVIYFTRGICSSVRIADKSSLAMEWTDDTLPILTSCLKKNISLPDDIIIALAGNLIQYLDDSQKSKSMKYSNLFHTTVTKYGLQIKELGLVQDLLDASAKVKSFMGKTIASSLQKL